MAAKRKKISAHVPSALIKEACLIANLNQTDALISGLKALISEHKRRKLVESAGKFHFTYDPDSMRERSRL